MLRPRERVCARANRTDMIRRIDSIRRPQPRANRIDRICRIDGIGWYNKE